MADYHDLLASVPLFSKLPKKTIDRLNRIVVEREYPPGKEIVTEGEIGTGFFMIVDGKVEVVRRQTEGALATLKKGDYFGEMALLDGGTRSATVRTVEPTRCLALTRWDFLVDVRQDTDLAVELCEV